MKCNIKYLVIIRYYIIHIVIHDLNIIINQYTKHFKN